MATRPTAFDREAWSAVHIYYHQGLDCLLGELVKPLLRALVVEDKITRFFFIRYRLGGSHLRLRLCSATGDREQLEDRVSRAVSEYLAMRPSVSTIDPEKVRRETEALVESAPNENDSTVYPDNTHRVVELQPEIDRYGGEDVFDSSLSVFNLTSLLALHHLDSVRRSSLSGQRMALCFRLLARQAFAFARQPDDALHCGTYAIRAWGERYPAILRRAELVFDHQRDVFEQLLVAEMAQHQERLDGERVPASLDEIVMSGLALLGDVLEPLSAEQRAGVGMSHLHMTANRLGLLNPEEVYLCRLFEAAVGSLRQRQPDFWGQLERSSNWWPSPETGLESAADALSNSLHRLLRLWAV